mgnify:CR=1 FL=1
MDKIEDRLKDIFLKQMDIDENKFIQKDQPLTGFCNATTRYGVFILFDRKRIQFKDRD